jgi:PAS domain-containing protein
MALPYRLSQMSGDQGQDRAGVGMARAGDDQGGALGEAKALSQAEAALRESEQKLRLAVDATGMGLWEWDIQTDSLVWDDTMLEIWGLTPEGCPRDRDSYMAPHARHRAGGSRGAHRLRRTQLRADPAHQRRRRR